MLVELITLFHPSGRQIPFASAGLFGLLHHEDFIEVIEEHGCNNVSDCLAKYGFVVGPRRGADALGLHGRILLLQRKVADRRLVILKRQPVQDFVDVRFDSVGHFKVRDDPFLAVFIVALQVTRHAPYQHIFRLRNSYGMPRIPNDITRLECCLDGYAIYELNHIWYKGYLCHEARAVLAKLLRITHICRLFKITLSKKF